MVPWVARCSLIAAGLLIALALAGCARVEMESELEADGSARHTVTKSVDPTMFEDVFEGLEDIADEEELPDEEALEEEVGDEIDRDEIAAGFDRIVLDAVDAGLDPERIDEPDQIGVRISTEAEPDADLGTVLNELYTLISDDTEVLEPFAGSFDVTDDENGQSRQQLELTADGEELVSPGVLLSGTEDDDDDILEESFIQGIEDSLEEDPSGAELREVFGLTYTVSMSGEIIDHNGTDLGDGRVRFDLPFQGSESFFAEADVTAVEESGFPLGLTLGIGGGILILVLIIAGGVVMMRNREPAPEA